MQRNCDLSKITDGRSYGLNDMVRTGCDDCKGCSACCQGMGSSILLDPLDIYNLCSNMKMSFEQLLAGYVELNVVDGIILPNLRMDTDSQKCSFLNKEGRCTVHTYRPGICRIFPLARVYDNNDFKYVLQTEECVRSNRTKVKVDKWIDTPELETNQKYIKDWHFFLRGLQNRILSGMEEAEIKNISMVILQNFFLTPYSYDISFYPQFYDRLSKISL